MRRAIRKIQDVSGKRARKRPVVQFDPNRKVRNFYIRAARLALAAGVLSFLPEAFAMNGLGHPEIKPKWAIDDSRWITLGAGFRGSGVWVENPSADNSRTLFSIDNARVFLNGQIHKYIKFESYTDCTFCNNTDPGDNPRMSYTVLAAIGKVEFNRYINIWGGRMQIPTERGEWPDLFTRRPMTPSRRHLFRRASAQNSQRRGRALRP